MSKKFLKFSFFLIICSCSLSKSTKKVDTELILNGKITRTDLEKNFAWFRFNFKNYKVDSSSINQIKKLMPSDFSMKIFMGTWCEDSKDQVPKFFKVADVLLFSESQITVVAVDRNKKCESVDLAPYKIELVPTFIFYKDGKEIGRIVETPKESFERNLIKILQDAK